MQDDRWVDEGPERWRYDAKCKDITWSIKEHVELPDGTTEAVYYDMWFPPRDKDKYKALADMAKATCFGRDGAAECPVRLQCLLYAEDNDEQHGIWGGLSHRERNALRRKAESNGMTLEQWVKQHRNLKARSKSLSTSASPTPEY